MFSEMAGGNRKPNTKLVELRVNRGMSPEQLAYFTGLSAPTIRLAERGHLPQPRTQFAIAEAFGLSPTDIWPLERQVALR
jgi:transcriptional regulator with XRE-family HTH domain